MGIQRAFDLLIQGELIVFPTETVYGLGGLLWKPEAIKKIFALKQRSTLKPLSALLASISQVEEIAEEIPPTFYRIAEAFFPGPLTVVLNKKKHIPDVITGGLPTIGIRIPSHPLALELCRAVGEPLVATSANVSGQESLCSLEEMGKIFPGIFCLEGEAPIFGRASTVISLTGPVPVLLREGPISFSDILKKV